jgi:hypothetical protein
VTVGIKHLDVSLGTATDEIEPVVIQHLIRAFRQDGFYVIFIQNDILPTGHKKVFEWAVKFNYIIPGDLKTVVGGCSVAGTQIGDSYNDSKQKDFSHNELGYYCKCKKRPDNLMLSGLLFKCDCELLLVLLEVTNGVVNGLALILSVEQKREVVGTQP